MPLAFYNNPNPDMLVYDELLSKKTKQRWITDYALPISLILGMASAIPFTMWLS